MSGTQEAAEAALYADVWTTVRPYGVLSPGEQSAALFAEWATPGASVLDAGCGSGKGGLALAAHGYAVTLCDLTPEGLTPEAERLPFFTQGLWRRIEQPRASAAPRYWWDYVYCCDVLEHLPTQYVGLTITHLLGASRRGLFLTVSNAPDAFGAWVGRPLHQTVQPFVWWRDTLRELGTVVDARDLVGTSLFLVTPR